MSIIGTLEELGLEEVLDNTSELSTDKSEKLSSKHEQISLKWIRVNYKQQVYNSITVHGTCL